METIKSIEEKAKSFKEALSRAKGFYKRFPEYKEILEKIFPELKESEGERIWIINYLSNRILNSTIIAEKENLKKAIAWLEKKGEQKPAWSKEDEEALEVAIIALEDMYSEDSPLDCYAGHHMPFDKAANQLKSIKERVACEVNCTTIKEWSEEDRKIIIELIGIFESAVDGGHVSFPYRLIKDYIRVLKSCLPQTTWKPSGEMLEALYRVIPENVMEKSEDEMLLDKLYQGLKYGKVLSEK